MFFFSGFGSLIPYAIYISVVWICVLIGFRSQLFSFFLSGDKPENISFAEAGSEHTDQKCYILNVNKQKDNLPGCDPSEYSIYSGYRIPDHFITKVFILPGRIVRNITISGNLLRAPPFHFISCSV